MLGESSEDIILKKRVWLDETYYSVRADNLEIKESGLKPRGLSRNQLCIGVACDEKSIVCVCEGVGQPTKVSTYDAFKDHIEPGSVLVHNKSAAHSLLISELGLVSEEYDSYAIQTLLDSENPMNRVNEVHARLKSFLYAHNSFDRDSLPGYLNLFSCNYSVPTS